MGYAIAGIEIDDGNRDHCQKHGVTLSEIAEALAGPLYRFPDPSQSEQRIRAIGKTATGRHVFLVYALREREDGVFIRPVSVRFVHKKEIDAYEKAAAATARN